MSEVSLVVTIRTILSFHTGFAIAKGFAANGAKVYITGRREETLRAAAASLPANEGVLIPYVYTSQQYSSNTKTCVQIVDGCNRPS